MVIPANEYETRLLAFLTELERQLRTVPREIVENLLRVANDDLATHREQGNEQGENTVLKAIDLIMRIGKFRWQDFNEPVPTDEDLLKRKIAAQRLL
jgi:hypothetical protein